METTLAGQALDKLNKHTGIKGFFMPITNRKTDIDGKVTLCFENQIQTKRNVESKKRDPEASHPTASANSGGKRTIFVNC